MEEEKIISAVNEESSSATPEEYVGGSRYDESAVEDHPVFEDEGGIEPEPTTEKKGVVAQPAAGEAGEAEAAKPMYTPEELENILKSDGVVDTSRLTPEGRLLMKSFQRGLDQKFQQIAEMRKAIEAQSKANDPREQLFQRYMQDPSGVIGEINSEIMKLEMLDPTHERYREARETIAKLQALKDDFIVRRQQFIEHNRQVEALVASTQAEIIKAIPDFETKAPKLTEFAQTELELSLPEIQALTDPTIVGPLAVKLTKAINKIYDKINASKTAESKVKKAAPPPLQRAGTGGLPEKKTEIEDPGLLPMSEYLSRRKKFAE